MKFSLDLGNYNIVVEAKNNFQLGSDVILTGSTINLELPFESDSFFSHGWQSWSLTAWLVERKTPTLPILPNISPCNAS